VNFIAFFSLFFLNFILDDDVNSKDTIEDDPVTGKKPDLNKILSSVLGHTITVAGKRDTAAEEICAYF